MGRIDEEHMTLPPLGRIQDRLQLGVEKIRLDGECSAKLFLGGTGMARRCHFRPKSLRNFRTWVGPRRSPVSW